MKKVLIILFVIAAVIFMLDDEPKKVTYSESEMREAIEEAEYYAYKEGYERGYDEAEYYLTPKIEEIAGERAYEAGYERGYEIGYDDCLEDHGLIDDSYHGTARIEKDR